MEAPLESREQSVSLLELFYDLVYVYAISRVTGIFRTPDYGLDIVVDYLVSSFVVLQAWMYMTNYINRFGRTRRTNAALVVNMCAAVAMSTTLGSDWAENLPLINGALFVMLGTVAVLYASHLGEGPSEREMAIYSLKTLVPVCAVYLVVGLAARWIHPTVDLALDVAAVAWGIFGPALIAPRYTLDLSLISFPHLVERFELITIITFGEAVVTVAEVFNHVGLGLESVATFLNVTALFGCYVVVMHNLTDHTRRHRGLRLIYCHFLLVMAIDLYAVSLNLMVEGGQARPRVCNLAALALALFYVCLSILARYRRDDVRLSVMERNELLILAIVGVVVTMASGIGDITAFLAGPLVSAGGSFFVLRGKDLELQAARGAAEADE